jgi:hypothetical protein
MPAIFDLLYREYCRARLAEMRKQLLISPDRSRLTGMRSQKHFAMPRMLSALAR